MRGARRANIYCILKANTWYELLKVETLQYYDKNFKMLRNSIEF